MATLPLLISAIYLGAYAESGTTIKMATMEKVLILLALASIKSCQAYEPLAQGNCPSGFITFANEKCLHVSTDYFDTNGQTGAPTWKDARERCMAKSNDVWTVDLAYSITEEILFQFSNYIKDNHPGMTRFIFWVGAQRTNAVSHWEWNDGQLVDPMSYIWHMPSPDLNSKNTRGMLIPSGNHNRFYMAEYSDTAVGPSFICEAAPKCNRS